MKKFWNYMFAFVMCLLVLVGWATIIRSMGGSTETLLYLLTFLFCGNEAADFIKDDKEKVQ